MTGIGAWSTFADWAGVDLRTQRGGPYDLERSPTYIALLMEGTDMTRLVAEGEVGYSKLDRIPGLNECDAPDYPVGGLLLEHVAICEDGRTITCADVEWRPGGRSSAKVTHLLLGVRAGSMAGWRVPIAIAPVGPFFPRVDLPVRLAFERPLMIIQPSMPPASAPRREFGGGVISATWEGVQVGDDDYSPIETIETAEDLEAMIADLREAWSYHLEAKARTEEMRAAQAAENFRRLSPRGLEDG